MNKFFIAIKELKIIYFEVLEMYLSKSRCKAKKTISAWK